MVAQITHQFANQIASVLGTANEMVAIEEARFDTRNSLRQCGII